MRKLQWGRFLVFILVAVFLLGLGFLMQHTLPEFMPFLQSGVWQWVAIIIYNVGRILLVLIIILFAIILITNSKSASRPERRVVENSEAYYEKALSFINALGGTVNINGVESCMSRIRVNISDSDEIDQNKIQSLGASGIFMSGNQVQIILGEESDLVRTQMEKILSEK